MGCPDLASIPVSERAQAIQTLYLCTGCDYVSFFQGMGKITFLKAFFRYAAFILGRHILKQPGSIGVHSQTEQNTNFLPFLRLIGCVYYTTHASAFIQRTPQSLFTTTKAANQQADDNEIHFIWVQSVRQVVWERADTESQTMPSTEALLLHWKRGQWVLHMWNQATSKEVDK